MPTIRSRFALVTTAQRTLRWALLLGLTALALVAAMPSTASADARSDARAHYNNGRTLFASGDFEAAISEFQAADKLAPSGVNDFNIGLAYQELGMRAEAVAAYRSYLNRVPDAGNRTTVEASITKLEGAMGADEAARAEEARRAAAADEAARAEEARRAAEDAARNGGGGEISGGVGPSSGDPELDRVAAVDVNTIRDQRQLATPAGAGNGGGAAAGGGVTPPAPTGEPKKSKPIYKQWWFWVVVGVSAYVLISIAAADSNDQPQQFRRLPMPSPGDRGDGAGATLWRF